MSKDIPSEGKAKVLLFRRDFLLFGTVVYNIWTKRVGDLDYELYKQYGCERYVEMLHIINEAWKGNVDAYLAGVIRGVARFISVYEVIAM